MHLFHYLFTMIKKTLISKKTNKKIITKRHKKSHNKNVSSKTFFYSKPCLCCNNKLNRVSSANRYLSSKEWRFRIFIEVFECTNESCKLYKQKIKSPEFLTQVFPGVSYGIDIIAEIWVLRFKEHKTFSEINNILMAKYPHIEITDRHLENLTNMFMVIIEESAKNIKIIKDRLSIYNINGLLISVDWIQPEQWHEILYVIRELQTWEILFAKYLEFSDKETIKKELYEYLKKISVELNLPILWLVADKQQTLTSAFLEVFPNVPVQHCQSHFIKEIRTLVNDKSSAMAKDIKKTSNDWEKLKKESKK